MKTTTGKKADNVVLVTGASGFLGTHLLQLLLEKKEKHIRVLALGVPQWIKDAGIEVIDGSILEPSNIINALDGVKQIYHLAGKVSRSEEDRREMYSVHINGTRLLCEAAIQMGVRRIVMASSSGTVAITEDGTEIPDEDYPTPVEIIAKFPYYASKLYQEKTARSICKEDQIELVIMNPSLLLGPGDDRLSSTTDVLKFLAGDIPAIPPGGVSFVDARDAAAGFYAAMHRGIPGQRYLLGGPNWTMEQFFEHLEHVSKVSAPRFKIKSKKLHKVAAIAMEEIYDRLGKKPPVEKISMEMGRYFWYLDCSKAQRDLGWSARDPNETLFDTVEYLRKHFLGHDAFK